MKDLRTMTVGSNTWLDWLGFARDSQQRTLLRIKKIGLEKAQKHYGSFS